ncbi:MICOS complex subunit MIC25 isoform X4 [Gallus gallus]|uniref:MICOS complex subunit MIC25 isoform X4 n=1 Tax=Gallus gallus TaxID=9031 RepID=UPI001F006166|nr:MICOS complex subunit MIC25 isoform X4 [Gallus gallus]XP_046782655.1 MICOS complex subunit MIC25 isoform X4 [Gallus gallus]
MGGSESSQGGRKVSFGLDERDQVRVLQGIRLTEDVVNRMKESQSKRDNQRSPHSSSGTAPFSTAAEGKPKSPTGIQPPTASNSGQKATVAEQELYRRYEQEQALVQEELLRLAKREREAAGETLSTALQRERNSTNEERKRVAQLALELQGREAELKRQEAFYKEQLARIERKNAEIYKLTSEQYQEAATKAEEWIKRRNTDPVCASLQSEILKCYQENQREVLKCSELAKEYQRCVSAAQKSFHFSSIPCKPEDLRLFSFQRKPRIHADGKRRQAGRRRSWAQSVPSRVSCLEAVGQRHPGTVLGEPGGCRSF